MSSDDLLSTVVNQSAINADDELQLNFAYDMDDIHIGEEIIVQSVSDDRSILGGGGDGVSTMQTMVDDQRILGGGAQEVQAIQSGNIQYILPNSSIGGEKQAVTAVKTPTTTATIGTLNNTTATYVINQTPVGLGGGGAGAGPPVMQSMADDRGVGLPVAQKSTTVAVKPVVMAQKSHPTIPTQILPSGPITGTVTGQAGPSSQPQPQQQFVILSPVKQNPVAKQGTPFVIPAMKMILPQGATANTGPPTATKLQIIAPAPAKGQQPQQRVLAPAPAIVSSKQPIVAGKQPMQTIVHATSGVGGKNVQYISFVPMSGSSTTPGYLIQNQTKLITAANTGSGATKYVPLKPLVQPSSTATGGVGTNKPIIATAAVSASSSSGGGANQTLKPNMLHLTPAGITVAGGAQKVVLSSNPAIKLASSIASGSSAATATRLTATSTGGAGGKPTSIWMLPKQNLIKMDGAGGMGTAGATVATSLHLQPTNKPLIANAANAPSSSKFVPIAPNPAQAAMAGIKTEDSKSTTLAKLPLLSSSDNYEESRRKPCNCTRSQCLKLYCDCFANGEFCNNCNCVSCCNNLQYEEVRQKAIRLCLERNPNAFHPKIGQQATHGDGERKHTKGCCCKRSGCLKNYCECYEAKILCSDKCKCVGCKNFEESTERKTLMHLADAAEFRSVQQAYTSKVQIWGSDLKLKLPVKVKSDTHPFNIFTMDMLEATASCLLAQAEEGEFENYPEENIESLILDQFGECLSQILNMPSNGTHEEIMEIVDEDDQPNNSNQQSNDDHYHHELYERT